MAAPWATFRRLVPLGRALPPLPLLVRAYGVRASATGELVTHTGQVYDEKDYRRVRFVGRQKETTRWRRRVGGNKQQWGCQVALLPNEKLLIGFCGVNRNFAIDLIAEQPVSEVESRVISCDGGGGALGHPKVYINLDKDTKTGTCGYCGLQFKQQRH